LHLSPLALLSAFFFFFNDPATTELYTLSLHDALPILRAGLRERDPVGRVDVGGAAQVRRIVGVVRVLRIERDGAGGRDQRHRGRSEEHTSELQSLTNLVCRLLLEKKKKRRCESTTLDT